MRRMLTALGYSAFEPTEEQRRKVRILSFNNTPVERIAVIMEMPLPILTYYFAKDLDLATDAIVTHLTEKMLELATQRDDKGIAFKAGELVLKTRSKAWRVPADVVDQGKPVEQMSLVEVDDAIARVERAIRELESAAQQEAPASDEQG